MTSLVRTVLLGALMTAAAVSTLTAQAGDTRYRVTITNLTKGQTFTPILLATHSTSVRVFAPGTQASPQLQLLAEEGATDMLAALLRQTPIEIREIVAGTSLLTPAVTISFEIAANGRSDRLSVAAMLIPTNDAFFGINSLKLPGDFDPVVVDALAYDSGTETNDERCASIPGPSFSECGGPGGGRRVGNGEGAITVHNGMHGVGDFSEPLRDWRGPVARVTIQRIP